MSSFENLIAELSTSVGQGIYDSVRSNIIHEDQHYGPENKKDCPCDTCPMFDTCKVDMTECSAMRNWCSTGDYWDTDGWDTKTVIRLVNHGHGHNKTTKKKVEVKYWHKSDVQRLIRACS